MKPRIITGGIALIALAVQSLVSCSSIPGKPSFSGSVITPPIPAANFELTNQNGLNEDLSSLKGKIVLLFFGYTNCPDECPLTMAKLSEAFDLINESGDHVQVLLITTDPNNDTPEKLKSYLNNFQPSFMGLTGTSEALSRVYKDYGVTVMDKGEIHSNRIYVIDRAGDLRMTWLYETPASDIAADLKILLKE